MTDFPQYDTAHVHRALAEDPRTSELGVQVRLDDGTVVLTGTVTTEERRRQVELVVREQLPESRIRNEVRVTSPETPGTVETLGM
ncbi:BON domain-containing protein [Nocardia sp. NPDC046763]|uniref:BON domain-containing protein n=1 Tax=Nocardia sp. NPDC046763 TaxID=3155256 RepID=UPI0033FBB81C